MRVKRGFYILLACLLGLQPLMPLWAAVGPGCEMAAMHAMDHGGLESSDCRHCADCCDESDCGPLCQAVFSAPMALLPSVDVRQWHAAAGFAAPDSEQIPAGHFSPALRPPISR